GFSSRVRIKLGESFPTTGSIPVHVFVTDLAGGCTSFTAGGAAPDTGAGGCTSFTAAGAPGKLATWEGRMKQLFGQVNLSIGPFTYIDSNAPNQIAVTSGGISPE